MGGGGAGRLPRRICLAGAPAARLLSRESAEERSMSDDFPHASRMDRAPSAAPEVDVGLRQYLLGVYNYMAGGLALTGLVAYLGATSGFYASIVGTPVFWIALLAPLALVLFLGFRIEKISLGAAQLGFWAYAGLVGSSLSGIFVVYTGESIARVFFISAAAFGTTSLYEARGLLARGIGVEPG
jgi:FtsH-binding integral membrane protein